MNVEQLPLVSQVVESGAQDRIFDGLLLSGPLVIGSIAVLGRSAFTRAIAVLYIVVFVAHVLRNAVR